MKAGTGGWLAVIGALMLVVAGRAAADDVLPPCWRGQAGTTLQHWRFDANANPAAPEIFSNANGSPTLAVQPGQAAAGWVNQLFLFGTNQGVWDLGLSGTMTLTVPNQARPAGSWKIVWVQVYQYQDGIYTQPAAVSVPGATRVISQMRTNATTSFGGKWVTEKSVWIVEPCPASETIVITGGTNGAPSSAIDQVVVDTLCLDFTCPTNMTLNADAGQCSRANVIWTLPAINGCTFTNVTCTPANGSTFPVGTTPVSCVVRDAYGHVVNCSFTVTVADNQPPSANCPGNLTVPANPGLCGEVVTFEATVTDNCPGATINCVPPSGAFFSAGSTTVTCTARDVAGQTSQCSFTVTVVAPPSAPGDAFPPCWRGRADTTHQDWAFNTPANPTAPELVNNPSGLPSATILPGAFSDGWQTQISGLGCRQGVWDLGTHGSIFLDITNRAGAASSEKYLRIQITQWQDGALYSQLVAVSFPNIPGATPVSHPPATAVETIPGVGRWVVDQQVWRLAPCPDTELIKLAGGPLGSLIDEVIVDTVCQDFICAPDLSTIADAGQCFASGLTWALPAVDGCLVRAVSCATNGVLVTQPATFSIGLTAVTCVINDAENQPRLCAFNVTVIDVDPPSITTCPLPRMASAGAGCLAGVPDFTTGVVATDCSGPLTITQSPLAGTLVGPGPHAVTLTVTDAANNASTCVTSFTVADTTPPVIDIGQSFGNGEVTLECGLGWGFTFPILSDNCDAPGSVTLNIFSTVTNAVVCGNSFTATRVWQAIDTSGNTSYATQIVHQVDHTPPQITSCPADLSVSCLDEVPAPDVSLVSATDYCDSGFGVYPPVPVLITYVSDVASGICPKTITRTYKATDACGNSATCTQTIIVNDTVAPVLACPPAVSVQCDADVPLPNFAGGGVSDNCDPNPVVTHVSDVAGGSCPKVIVRTYKARDFCGNEATCTQTIIVNDTMAPVLTCPAAVSVQCDSDVPLPDFAGGSVSDNCDASPVVTHVSDVASGSFPKTIARTYKARDLCGNEVTCTQTITVNDTLAPLITGCPAARSASAGANCQAEVPDFTSGVTATDNCDTALTITQNPLAGTLVGQGPHHITLTVTDDAGNAVNCATTFTVQPLADLSVSLVSSPEPVTVGNPVSYSLTVLNAGPCAATGVVLNNVLSAGQVLVSVTDPGTAIARACPTPGPSAWWRAEGAANDSVGLNHGTIHGGVTFTPQAVAQGFNFDGLSGYISVPDAPALRPASLTIEGWIKVRDPNGLHVVLSKAQGAGTADSYSLWIGSGALFAAVSDNAGSGPTLSYPNFPTSSIFTGPDIIDLPSLALKLKVPLDPVSVFLNGLLSPATLTRLATYVGGPDPLLLRELVSDLNRIIQSGAIYSPALFAGVILAPETQYLLGRNPTGTDLVRLNRLLIRDAYPTEIQSNVFPELNVRYHVAYTFNPATQKQALYVNGALVDSSFVTKTITYDNRALFIGASDNGVSADNFYQGELDELAIYDRALSGIEVQSIYNAGANGKCFSTGPIVLGSLAGGASQTLTVVTVPILCPSVSLQATVSGAETDPILPNNSATATVSVSDLPDSQVSLRIRRISPNNDRVEISWPITCALFNLETSVDLSPYPAIVWGPALVPLQTLQGRYSTVVPASDPHRFFRLKKQ